MNSVAAPGLAALPGVEHAFGTRHTPLPQPLRTLKQVHSCAVHSAGSSSDLTEGDALISAEPGLWIAVKTADCVPILLADRNGRAVGAVHAGWRGTLSGIVRSTVERLCSEYYVSPDDLFAAIGPAIGPCCYEVGPEVASLFDPDLIRHRPAPYLDLRLANQRLLLRAGLPAAQVEIAGPCTRCRPDLFHSYRRDGARAGRMYSAIRLRPEPAPK